MKTVREEVLKKAAEIVTKDRQNTYGKPEDNFKTIANLWSAYLGHGISSADVTMMMSLLKIARTKSSPDHMDNYIDIAGYAACGAEVAKRSETAPEQESKPDGMLSFTVRLPLTSLVQAAETALDMEDWDDQWVLANGLVSATEIRAALEVMK